MELSLTLSGLPARQSQKLIVAGIIFRIISGGVLLVAGFLGSNAFYFSKTPLFNVPYLGQTLAAFLLAAIGLSLVPHLFKIALRGLKKWLTAIIRSSVSQSVGSFMASQATRLRESGTKSKESDRKQREIQKETLISNSSSSTLIPIILDTSAIIDGRVLEVVKLGFLEGRIVVPQFVIKELQTLSDSSDEQKRIRGRRGLDLLEDLRQYLAEEERLAEFEISEEEIKGKDTDEKLLKLCKKLNARVATVDFNLNKAGRVSGVRVLNVNDLANGIKTPLVPGDRLKIKVVHEGKDGKQGVGYLADGTMIVIEAGKEFLGKEVEVEVSRFLQTSAGKMVFGKLINS